MKTTHFPYMGIPATMTVLPNGFTVASCQTNSQFVEATLVFAAGSVDDGEYPGISHLLEHALFEGPARLGGHPLTRKLINQAVKIDAATSNWHTYYNTTKGTELSPILDALFGMTGNILIGESGLAIEKQVASQELWEDALSNDRETWLMRQLFPTAPWLHHPIVGSDESLQQIMVRHLRDYRQRLYTPANSILAIASRHSHAEVLDMAQYYSLAMDKCHTPRASRPILAPVPVRADYVTAAATEETMCYTPLPATPIPYSDRFLLNAVAMMLDTEPHGILYHRIRTERGLTYSLNAAVRTPFTPYFTCSVPIPTQFSSVVIEEYVRALHCLHRGIYRDELIELIAHDRAKSFLAAQEQATIVGCEDIMVDAWLGCVDLLYDPAQLSALITRESISRVVGEYLLDKPYGVIRTVKP